MTSISYRILTHLIMWDAAVVQARDSKGFTPLHRACEKGALIVVKAFKSQLQVEDVRETQTCDTENTPLHIACMNGDSSLNIVRYLIEQNANVNATNINRETPLHISASNGFTRLTQELLRRKVNVDVEDISGRTPLVCAAMSNQEPLISLLLPR